MTHRNLPCEPFIFKYITSKKDGVLGINGTFIFYKHANNFYADDINKMIILKKMPP